MGPVNRLLERSLHFFLKKKKKEGKAAVVLELTNDIISRAKKKLTKLEVPKY